MLNKLTALLSVSALALMLTVASPAMANSVDVEGENTTTGADSVNKNDHDVDQDSDVDLDNDADIDNKVDADVNTGDNETNMNTTSEDSGTGAIDGSVDWDAVANVANDLTSCDCGTDVHGDFSNDTTGYDSDNKNELDLDIKDKLDVDNDADVDNAFLAWLNTGKNKVNMNTTHEGSGTGDIETDVASTTYVNSDNAYSNGGGVDVDVDGSNYLTGADSKNKNVFDINNDTDVDVKNDADVKNITKAKLNTGGNKTSKNTTVDGNETGDIDFVRDDVVVANVGNSYGSDCNCNGLDVDADFSNDTTGYGSKNTNKLNVDNDYDLDVDNKADIENKVELNANTGKNDVSKNTTVGGNTTGDVSFSVTSSTEVNSN